MISPKGITLEECAEIYNKTCEHNFKFWEFCPNGSCKQHLVRKAVEDHNLYIENKQINKSKTNE